MKLWRSSLCTNSNPNQIVHKYNHCTRYNPALPFHDILIQVHCLYHKLKSLLMSCVCVNPPTMKLVHMKAITPYRHAFPTRAAPTQEHPNAQSMCPLQSCTTLFHDVFIQMHCLHRELKSRAPSIRGSI